MTHAMGVFPLCHPALCVNRYACSDCTCVALARKSFAELMRAKQAKGQCFQGVTIEDEDPVLSEACHGGTGDDAVGKNIMSYYFEPHSFYISRQQGHRARCWMLNAHKQFVPGRSKKDAVASTYRDA